MFLNIENRKISIDGHRTKRRGRRQIIKWVYLLKLEALKDDAKELELGKAKEQPSKKKQVS